MAGRKHKLNLTFHSDYREHADGHVNIVYAYIVNKATVKARAYLFGDSVNTHTAVAEFVTALYELTIKADGRCDLNYNRGKSGFGIAFELVLIEAKAVVFGIRSEYRNVLFAAVKNDLLVKGAKTFYLLNSAAADAGFESYTEVITDSHLIEALIEGDGFDIDVGVDHFDTFASYSTRFIDYLLSHIAKVNADVLKTVLVACGIENLIYADAAQLFGLAAKPLKRAVSFNH